MDFLLLSIKNYILHSVEIADKCFQEPSFKSPQTVFRIQKMFESWPGIKAAKISSSIQIWDLDNCQTEAGILFSLLISFDLSLYNNLE